MEVVEIEKWCNAEIKTITLTQDVGDCKYNLQVRKFVPVEGDAVHRTWKTNGEAKTHACTEYAIANMGQTGPQLLNFARNNILRFIYHYIPKEDKLMFETYRMAFSYAQNVTVSFLHE